MSSLKYHNITNKLRVKSYKLKVIGKSFIKFLTLNFSLFTFLLFFPSLSSGAEITGPEVKFQGNDIYVTTSLNLDEKYLRELSKGITKEVRFYIDIFRVWKMWPDEFMLGKLFIRTLTCDPVKNEYIATSGEESTLIQKRFRSFESMIKWALSINDLKLANLRELEPSVYYIRVTVESKIRKLPPVIGYFMIFLPENEFKISKNSTFFTVSPVQ
jgi:hypothetical protein